MANRRGAFVAGIRALPPDRFVDFVAELFTARGRTVRRDGPRSVHVLDADHGRQRVQVTATVETDGDPPDSIDVVVTASDTPALDAASEIRVVGPSELFELVHYAIDDADRDRLLREYVDPSLAGPARRLTWSRDPNEGDDGDEGASDAEGAGVANEASDGLPDDTNCGVADSTDGGAASESSPPTMVAPDRATKAATADESGDRAVRRRTALVAGLGFVAGVGVPASIATLGDDESSTSPPEPGDTSEPSSVVDGVSRSGVTDPDRVAVGHVEAIAERSYSLAATKTVRGRAGRLLSAFRTDIDVSPDQGFLVHVSARGPAAPAVVGEPPARADYWSDGQQYVRRLSNATRAVSGEYTPNDRLDQQFYWSRTVPFGGRPFTAMFFYRDVFETVPTEALRVGDPAAVGYLLVDAVDRLERPASIWTALARNRAVEAIDLLGTVTPRGIVDTLDLHYRGTDGEQPLEVHWRIDYRHVGETVVERPTWVDRALRV